MKPIYALSLIAALAWGCQPAPADKPANPRNTPETIAVRLSSAQVVNSAETVVATGLLTPRQEVRLSFKVGGIIDKLYVHEGQTIGKGQLLASLNTTELSAQVEQASQMSSKAERDWQRTERLYKDSVATLEQFQNQTTVRQAARQTLTMAMATRNLSRLYATISGVVRQRPVNEGELVAAGTPVVLLTGTNTADWVLRVGVADKAWLRLRPGDRASVTLDALGQDVLTAQVVALSQGADPGSGLYQVDLLIRAGGRPLVAGLFGKATIFPAGRQHLIALPADAIVEGDNAQTFAFVQEGAIARKRPVNVLYIKGDKAFVALTDQAFSAVITDGSAYLEDGSPIRVIH